ncbi:MAG: hypothetical protein IJT90_03785 [Bacteroidaceae bacterium]|nr:hypothetical protein [Bacteroidaceae bacterium]
MCTVSVKVNEDVLRDYLPELENTAAIRKWVQMLIDQRIDALMKERAAADGVMELEETRDMIHAAVRREYAFDRDMTPDELYNIVAEEIDSIYALG